MNKMKNIKNNIWLPVALLPVWYLVYHNLKPVTDWLTDSVFGMDPEHMSQKLSVSFFLNSQK